MAFNDDDRPRKKPVHELGSDLSMLAADELAVRIVLLKTEIARIEAEIVKKTSGRAAAESFFRS